MGLFKNWLGSSYTMQVLIIRIIGLLGWLSGVAIVVEAGGGQVDEAVTGAVQGFPNVGITCIGNLAILITSLLRGRLDLEMAARDFLATRRGPKLEHIHRFGLKTCKKYKDASVLLLSFHSPNSSITQFMRYISSAHGVQSILLECLPLRSAALLAEICNCNDECKCIVFCTVEAVSILLAHRISGTLKRMTDTLCVLLCRDCLKNGCHGCDQGLLYVEFDRSEGATDESKRVRLVEDEKKIGELEWLKLIEGENEIDEVEGVRLVEGKRMTLDGLLDRFSVLEALDHIYRKPIQEEGTCICIPLRPAEADVWTDLMTRSLRSKDKEGRGVRVMASDALENYMALGAQENYMSTEIVEAKGIEVTYSNGSLIVPRVIEMFLNLAVTGWFRTDGFSTSLLARRSIRDYVVDSRGNGFAINAYVTYAWVKSSQVRYADIKTDHRDVCQVLTFRGTFLSLRTLAIIGACVNLICSFDWSLLVAIEGHVVVKWYYTPSMPLSETRLAIIMGGIVTVLVMDCLHLYLGGPYPLNKREREPDSNKREREPDFNKREREADSNKRANKREREPDFNKREREPDSNNPVRFIIVCAMIVLEIACIALLCSTLARVRGIKGFDRWRWIYSALQVLVWVKWAAGSYLLGERLSKYDCGPIMTEPLAASRAKKWTDNGMTEPLAASRAEKWTDSGILVYSSAFLLNAFLAGVRGKWDYNSKNT